MLVFGLGGVCVVEMLKNVLVVGSLLCLFDVLLLEGGEFKVVLVEGCVLVVYWWVSWCLFCV